MSRRKKIPAKEKVRIVEDYLSGKTGYTEAELIAGVGSGAFRRWISRYKAEGPEGLKPTVGNRMYPPELKEQAAKDYIEGKGSLKDIREKYNIRSEHQLQNWIKVYNRHEEFRTITGGCRMTKGRKTTTEERLAIAKECLANGNNYGETTLKYQVSYQQVYTWCKKLRDTGEAGLEDGRGRRSLPHEPQTEEERLRAELVKLEKENYRLQVENAFLKKLKEVEGRNR
jgi:transposase-like protein